MKCFQDETARICMYENNHWSPIVVMMGLISCSVPPYLKAELFSTISALVKTPEIATAFWQIFENSQVNKLVYDIKNMFHLVLSIII